MPLQNRVTPFNTLEAVNARGTLTGNRGILHDANKTIGKSTWKHSRWITCVLDFKGRRRALMEPGRYTHLFFLDEAVSLSAGHRPCRECRKTDYDRYVAAWKLANGIASGTRVTADEIDAALHVSRVTRERTQARFSHRVDDLPDGSLFTLPDQPAVAWLLWKGAMHRWSSEGYVESRALTDPGVVTVLTPLRNVDVLRAGYVPAVHPTAGSLSLIASGAPAATG